MSANNTKISVQRRTLLVSALAGIAMLTLAGGAQAFADPVDLAVVDRDTGQALQVWRHDGRLFVAGRTGARYALRVTNNTNRRVMIVLSVDGVNIYTGQTAGYEQSGYIFRPYQSYEVSGWRKTTEEVAAFTFAPLQRSYAAQTGRPANVGVIGMAVFDERVPPVAMAAPPGAGGREERANRGAPSADEVIRDLSEVGNIQSQSARGYNGNPAPAPPSSPAPQRQEERLGTGHGERERSVIQIENFERASSTPFYVWQVEYDTRANLVVAGVIPTEPTHPRPFPVQPDNGGFVPDPPRRR